MSFDASYWCDIFTQALTVTRQWAAEQAKADAIFTAAIEFHGRLQLLGNADKPAAIASVGSSSIHSQVISDALPRLRNKHVHGLENLLAALHTSAGRFEELRRKLSELHTALWTRHAAAFEPGARPAELAEPSCSVVGAGRGTDAQRVFLPPPMQCIEWVQELDSMFTAELLLKLELLESISVELGNDALHGIYRLWSLQPHLRPMALAQLQALVESLTLVEPTAT